MWRFAYGLCRDRSYADDLAQATCLKALQNIAHFKHGTHLDRWAFTICRNLWRNEARSRAVRFGNGCVSADDERYVEPTDPAEMNIFAAEVFTHVMQLPEAQREAVMLVYVEGYKYKEAAEMLGVPMGTIMSRLATARAALVRLNQEAKI